MLRQGFLFAAALLLLAPAVGAQEPRPYPTVMPKRIKPPEPGAARRILVQIVPIAPVAPAPLPPRAEDEPAPPPVASSLAWYWNLISPDLAASGPGRLAPAVRALTQGPGGARVPAPRLQQMQQVAARYGVDILKATVGTRVSPALVLAVIMVESDGQHRAVSRAGATGLMQLMPATAQQYGVADSLDPVQNIRGGVAFLDRLMQEFDRDPILVLASYNAGPGTVRSKGGVPPFAETRDYVPKVLAAWTVARGLCQTPPELISDGCVFRIGT